MTQHPANGLHSSSFYLSQKALEEFPEKELQLQQTEIQGQRVLKRTSEDGRVHILRDMSRLQESWTALYIMSLNIHRYKKDDVVDRLEVQVMWILNPCVFLSLPLSLLNQSMEQADFRGLSVEGTAPTTAEEENQVQLHSSGRKSGGSLEGVNPEYYFIGDELDSPASGFRGSAGERTSTPCATDVSRHTDKTTGGCSSNLAGDREEVLTMNSSYSDGAGLGSGEGPGGGAFLPFRRAQAKQLPTSPTQQPRVRWLLYVCALFLSATPL